MTTRNGAPSLRCASPQDLAQLLELYTHLNADNRPPIDEHLASLWREILDDPNHHVIVLEESGVLVSTCVLLIVPNLTRSQRPYALIENVVTRADCRKRGYATAVLDFARGIARERGCYKIMLMTGCKDEATLRFYEKAGYNRKDKTAFIQWLEL